MCKSIYDGLEVEEVRANEVYEKDPTSDLMLTCVKCPLTGKFIEKSLARKAYFC